MTGITDDHTDIILFCKRESRGNMLWFGDIYRIDNVISECTWL